MHRSHACVERLFDLKYRVQIIALVSSKIILKDNFKKGEMLWKLTESALV